MNRGLLLLCVLGLGIVHNPTTASAYSCISSNCARYCTSPVPYRLSKPSDDLGLSGSEAELKKAMEAWTAPSCSALKVQYGGTTNESAANANGVVAWMESGWTSGSGTIGVTTSKIARGCLEAHMVLNGMNFRWIAGATKSPGEVNAITILAHEGGHYLGLGHSTVAGAIMQARYAGGVVPLNADDDAGICKIYPGGGGAAVPQMMGTGAGGAGGSMVGGSGGMSASGGTGGTSAGSAKLCEACLVAADCASASCLRNDNTGARFCGQSCDGGCPSGFQCMSVNGTQGLRQCVPTTGSCAGLVTAPPSNSGSGGSGGASGGSPGGAPMGGSGGAVVSDCQQDTDCKAGFVCNPQRRCVADDSSRTILPDGETCETEADCQSGLCLDLDGRSFCSRLCGFTRDCVSGFSCQQQGDDKVCAPLDRKEDDNKEDDGDRGNSTVTGKVGGCSFGGGGGTTNPLLLIIIVGLMLQWLRAHQRAEGGVRHGRGC